MPRVLCRVSGHRCVERNGAERSPQDRGCARSGRVQAQRIPGYRREFHIEGEAAYVHYTSNNTIVGTQYTYVPAARDVPLICDMSSDLLSRPVELSHYSLIYAGAQKNLGPAGVTVVLIRRDLLERCRRTCHPP